MLRSTSRSILGALIVVVLVESPTAGRQTQPPAPATARITFDGGEPTQVPSILELVEGQEIVWTLVNTDDEEADIQLRGWKAKGFLSKGKVECFTKKGLGETVAAGQSKTVSFTPDAACFDTGTKKGKKVKFKYDVEASQKGKRFKLDPELEIEKIY